MRKIWLIGTTSSGALAPYKDESWEIWGVSARAAYVSRATRWFELHRLEGEGEAWAANWRKTIKTFSHDVELLMFYPEPDLGPRVVEYPHERITARFGTYFMSSTFAWMMALAIDELRPYGADPIEGEIGVCGVEMEYGTEYRQQRAGFRHFIDLAGFAGIPITRLADGGLAYEPIPYPMWQDDPLLNKLEARNMDAREKLKGFDESIWRTRTLIAQNRALMEEIPKFRQKGYRSKERLKQLEKETAALTETSASISRDIVHWQAVSEEQMWLSDYLSP